MATQDFNSMDTDFSIKDKLSEVQDHLSWKALVPVAIVGALGAIIYSRLNARPRKKVSRAKSKKEAGGRLAKTNIRRHSETHRAHA